MDQYISADSAHTDKDSAPPPALSDQIAQSNRSPDRTVSFVYKSPNPSRHSPYATAHPDKDKLSARSLFYYLISRLNTKILFSKHSAAVPWVICRTAVTRR